MPRWPDMDEAKRCTATSKRTGQRCGLARIPGTTVCAKHGGAAPQVRAAAARRVAEQKMRKAAMKLDVGLQDVSTDPVALLSGMIHSGAIMMERFSRLVDRCEDGQSPVYTAKSGVRQIRPEFTALRAERRLIGQPAPNPMPPSNGAGPSIADELRKLGELRDAGLLTEAEFAEQKARLLGS